VGSVLLLNSCETPLGLIDWQRAVSMLVTVDAKGVPIAHLHQADPDRTVRSPSIEVPFPLAIKLARWIYVKHIDGRDRFEGGCATRQGVLARDRHRCVYCGMPAETIDHVLPTSRGGLNTWENLAACCRSCNNRKADRLPEEAGMRLRWHPYRPDLTGYTQRKVRREQQLASA
jgi:HNH endonuclease